MAIRSKLPDIGTNIFSVMSSLANEHGAINLSQGFPNFDCDEELKALVVKHMAAGRNQYAPMPGVPELRAAIADKVESLYGRALDPDKHITITAGATQAIYTTVGAVISEGDNAIIFDPAYDAYAPAVKSYGGTVTPIALKAPDFGVDWGEVERMVNENTKLIVVNTPHNPLGRNLQRSDMLALQKIAIDRDLYVLSDEVYEHLVYDDQRHESVLRYPELWSRSFATFSFGKVLHATGWKVGYCIAPEGLMSEFRKVHQFVTFAVNTPIQHAIAEYIQDERTYLDLPNFFQEKRDTLAALLKAKGFDVLPCEGSYFLLADYSKISELHDLEFARWLTVEHGVATIPLSPFYSSDPEQKIVRFCFAKTDDLLERAAANLDSVMVGQA